MQTLVDADIYHVVGILREALVAAPFLLCFRRGAHDLEGYVILSEVQLQYAGGRAGDSIATRGIVGIWRCGQERLPRRVTSGRWIAVVLAFVDGGNRPPKEEVLLAVPDHDGGVGYRHTDQSQQPGAVIEALAVFHRNVTGHALEDRAENLRTIEVGEFGLLRCAGAVGRGTHAFHLVVVLGVLFALHIRWRVGAELATALDDEGLGCSQPSGPHLVVVVFLWWCRTPLSHCIFTRESGGHWIRGAP